MRQLRIKLAILIFFSGFGLGVSQNDSVPKKDKEPKIFSETDMVPIKLSYNRKELLKETNDSTFVETQLEYALNNQWNSIPIKIRARGNFRRKTCFFTPAKIEIKKSAAKNTTFRDDRKLKMVLPCLKEKGNNDNVIKEYLAYKIFEVLSPYYFRTRLLDVSFTDLKDKKTDTYRLKGFLIEEDDEVAKRLDGNVSKRDVYPKAHDPKAAMRNDFFQFMIGNTDYSSTFQHNAKLLFINKSFIPVPYDFDMCGFVNCSYAVVSKSALTEIPVSKVTERYYLGYNRGASLFQQVRQEFMSNRTKVFEVIDAHKSYFEDEQSFEVARNYIIEFFNILQNDSKFTSEILNRAKDLK